MNVKNNLILQNLRENEEIIYEKQPLGYILFMIFCALCLLISMCVVGLALILAPKKFINFGSIVASIAIFWSAFYYVWSIYFYYTKNVVLTNQRIIIAGNKSLEYIENKDVIKIESTFRIENLYVQYKKNDKTKTILIPFVNASEMKRIFLENTKIETQPIRTEKEKKMITLLVIIFVTIFFIFDYFILDKLNKSPEQKYMENLQIQIKKNWKPNNYNQQQRAVTIFKVAEDGTVSDIRILHSSGIEDFDNNAIETIRNSSPLPPLPRKLKKDAPVSIQFTFAYNIKEMQSN